MDEVRMTRPCPDAASAGRHACTDRMVPFRLVPSTSSMFSSVIAASGAAGKIPALAQSTSMPPSRSAAVAAIRWQSARRLTSPRMYDASPPPAASSATVRLAASSSRPVMSSRAPAPANTSAMPLPMPRVAPVTTTAHPAMDVNMLALPFPGRPRAGPVCREPSARGTAPRRSAEPAEVGLGQVAAPGRVRADPGDQQQPAVEDERPDLGLVLGGQAEHPAVPGQPGADQVRDVRLVLEEAHRRADVVQIPAEPAVVEVDDADRVAVGQQVGQPGVGVHQPVPLRPGAERGQPGPQRRVEPPEYLQLRGADPNAV